ncbi:MAG: NAD-dependent succinate-semialdehyde dehydrogenase [Solirubrobacterales bacterium]
MHTGDYYPQVFPPDPDTVEFGSHRADPLAELEVRPHLFVDGEWAHASGGGTFPVTDPGNGACLAEVSDAQPEDALRGLSAAAQAGPDWAATPGRQRADVLRALFESLTEKAEPLARLIALESGKAMAEARAEVGYGTEFLRWYSEEAAHLRGSYADSPAGADRFVVQRRPVGPCLLITPWNFPLAMVTRKLAPALAAGCSVVVKPPKETPLTALAVAGWAEHAGVPAGVLNVVPTARSAPLGEALLGDPRLRKLSFTGSTEVGRHLLRAASENLVRTSMELGGNAPLIIFADADLDLAVREAVVAKIRNGGESCVAANRIYVEGKVAEEFVERFASALQSLTVGHPLEGADVGPLINDEALERIDGLVADAVVQGSALVTGGKALPGAGPGSYYAPTVLVDVPPECRIMHEEIFGPVAPIQRFTSEEEVVRLANETPFGLASYLFTSDLGRSWRVADRLEAGMVGVNKGVVSNVAAPFGGVGASGLGREGGPEGLDEYLEERYILFGGTSV